MSYNEESSLKAIQEVLKTVRRLRAPDGCPWDKEQTHQSLRPHLIEEAYETLEVLDQVNDPADFKKSPALKAAFLEEWGDVFLQILLHAEIASENDPEMTIEHIAHTLNEKLIRRHPHVFGETQVTGSEQVMKNWDQIKKAEKAATGSTGPARVLDGIPKGMAPLPRTLKVIQKVSKVGFQWPNLDGPTQKLEEEVQELKEALKTGDAKKIESEIGDVLFSVSNIAHFLKLDPENALRSTLRKFESRFRFVEDRLLQSGKAPATSTLEEMDRYWDEAKKSEI